MKIYITTHVITVVDTVIPFVQINIPGSCRLYYNELLDNVGNFLNSKIFKSDYIFKIVYSAIRA